MSKIMRDVYTDYEAMAAVLRAIARGRADSGRPLAAETARQMARQVCLKVGERWEGIGGERKKG